MISNEQIENMQTEIMQTENEQVDTIKNYGNINPTEYLFEKFKSLYPDLNPDTVDSDLLENILLNIIEDDLTKIDKENTKIDKENTKIDKKNQTNDLVVSDSNNFYEFKKIYETNKKQNNFNKELIKQNRIIGNDTIPEMFVPTSLIKLNGKINGSQVNIMIDSGASGCVIFKSVIDKCNIDYLIDNSSQIMIQGAHGIKASLGSIWYLEIELEISKSNFVSIPITLEVIDDSEIIETNKILDNEQKKSKDEKKQSNDDKDNKGNKEQSHGFDMILGMNFLKSYKANIDFHSNVITLNNTIKIKF